MNTKPIILITGISGRIGTAVAKLFSSDFQIVGLDVRCPEEVTEQYPCLFTDLSAEKNVKDSLDELRQKFGSKIASCIHLAAYYNFTGGAWEKYQKITIDGTVNLLEALSSFDVDQFIFSSTMLVHATCGLNEKINEDYPLDPKWEYPLSKVKTEELIAKKKGKIKSVIFRIAGVYDDECSSIPISQQISRIFEKKLEGHLFPGNLRHGAAYLHMDDLMHALKRAVEKRKELRDQEVFVLGESQVLSYSRLQEVLGMLIHGKRWWTIRIPKWMAKMGAYFLAKLPSKKEAFIKPWMVDLADDNYILDTTRAQEILGWKPERKLKNCLPAMVEALKKDPEKWYKKHGL